MAQLIKLIFVTSALINIAWHVRCPLTSSVCSSQLSALRDSCGYNRSHTKPLTKTHTHTHTFAPAAHTNIKNHKLNMNFIHVSTPTHTRLQCKCCNLLWVCIKHTYIHTYINPYEYSLNKHTPTWSTQTDNVETKQKEKKARGRSKVEESWRRSRTTRDGENKQR